MSAVERELNRTESEHPAFVINPNGSRYADPIDIVRSPAAFAEILRQGKRDVAEFRKFDTGATRDTDEGKPDFEAFLSPLVLERYAEYMHKNRIQPDGSLRSGDNWQKGIPRAAYMKSLWRHFFAVWKDHRSPDKSELAENLCATLFNTMGYLHEVLLDRDAGEAKRI